MQVIPTLADRRKARKYKLKQFGIKYPATTVWAARRTNTPLAYACALLEQETGGGQNVFGHDPTIFIGVGKVTKQKYLSYKSRRGTTHMQGVGPCQLTWWATQDKADALGGCWKPGINMHVGFTLLMGNIKSFDLWDGIRRYNGSGEAAKVYANSVLGKIKKWENRFKGLA